MTTRLIRGPLALGAALSLVLVQTAAPTALAASVPTISIDTSGGTTPYSTVFVSGSGFSPGETINLYFGLSRATASADGDGAFARVPLIVPNVSAGTSIVLAIGATSGATAFSYVYVGALMPQVAPSAWWAPPGTVVTFSGSGFVPNESISATLAGSSTPFAVFAADASGAFTGAGALKLPYALANGVAHLTFADATSGASLPLAVGVGGLYPWATPSAWYILPGHTVTFSGGGFGPGEGVDIVFDASTTVLAHAVADGAGAFTSATPVMVPYGSGIALFRAVGEESGVSVAVPITRAAFYPTLTPSAYYSAPGGSISLAGAGFAPGETVDISVGSATTSATADANGSFSLASLRLPAASNVQVPVTATGQTSGATASFTMTMGQYYAWVTLSTYWAIGGSPLTVMGHNFAPGETVALSSVAGDFATTTAGLAGDFSVDTTVPYAPPGDINITATGEESATPASTHMTVAPVYTDIELGAYAGGPGAPVEFIGRGYVPHDVVEITTDRTGAAPVATIHADASGSFDDSSYSIPLSFTPGNLLFTIDGTKSFDLKSITYYVTGG